MVILYIIIAVAVLKLATDYAEDRVMRSNIEPGYACIPTDEQTGEPDAPWLRTELTDD